MVTTAQVHSDLVADQPHRLASLRLGLDGATYGVVGHDGRCEVSRFDPRTEPYELLGPVADGHLACWEVHDVSVTVDGMLYAGEGEMNLAVVDLGSSQ